MAFFDSAKIFVKAGNGGKGCRSFHRDRYHRHPLPDGGDGGQGGDVVLVADSNVGTLLDFKFRQHFAAENGGHGSGKNQKGKAGDDLIIKVPVGTLIRDFSGGFILRDVSNDGERVVIAKGGQGGKGNRHLREIAPPMKGEQKELMLELKLLADVGIVGFPNVGKSTLISRISQARPKIANYPFTTRNPVLGVVKTDDLSFVIADLPGLINGAHQGKGLGDRFLKHIEKTRVLLHLIDMAAVEGRDPVADYRNLNRELELYNPEFLKKPQILLANKMDLALAWENLRDFKKKVRKKIYPISGITGEGISQLLRTIRKILCKEPSIKKLNA